MGIARLEERNGIGVTLRDGMANDVVVLVAVSDSLARRQCADTSECEERKPALSEANMISRSE